MLMSVAAGVRPFEFERDTFAFRNELHWQYLIEKKISYFLQETVQAKNHCIIIVRTLLLFLQVN